MRHNERGSSPTARRPQASSSRLARTRPRRAKAILGPKGDGQDKLRELAATAQKKFIAMALELSKLISHGGLWRGCRPWAKMGVGLPADAVVSLALEAGV
jgi:hypothetical protein